jgi:hypothetical protein
MLDIGKPVEQAWKRMERRLFQPFQAKKWFVLGFTAWLASFLDGGSSGGNFNSSGSPSSDQNEAASEAAAELSALCKEWFIQAISWGLPVWIGIFIVLFVLFLALLLVFTWLGCRGRFMFLDNVLHDRAEVKRPWREFRTQGNSLFRLHAAVVVAGMTVFFMFVLGALITFWPDIVARQTRLFAAYLPWILAFVVLFLAWIPVIIFLFFLRDLGVPLMYRRGCSAGEACGLLWDLGKRQWPDFLLYLLIRIVLGLVLVITACIAGCLTCCIAFLPYIGTVITLPLWVFRQCFVLDCFAQISPEDNLWPKPVPPAIPPSS